MRPHNLRKYFRLRVGRYGRDEAEALMGHQAGLNRIYANFDDAEDRLEEVYKKSIEDLSIYQRGAQAAQVTEEMNKKIKELKDGFLEKEFDQQSKISLMNTKLGDLLFKEENNARKIDQLKEKNDQLEKKVANLERDIHHWKMIEDDVDKILTYTRLKMKEEAS